jgi:hypothetical protein
MSNKKKTAILAHQHDDHIALESPSTEIQVSALRITLQRLNQQHAHLMKRDPKSFCHRCLMRESARQRHTCLDAQHLARMQPRCENAVLQQQPQKQGVEAAK